MEAFGAWNKKSMQNLIKRRAFDDSDEIEIRLPSYWTFLTFWNILGWQYDSDVFFTEFKR